MTEEDRYEVLRAVTSIVRSESVAEDITQEAFARLERADDVKNPMGFVVTTARNLAYNHVRDARRQQQLREVYKHEPRDPPVTPLRALLDKRQAEDIQRALEALPTERMRTVVVGRMEGIEINTLAERLGISRRTVIRDWNAALDALRHVQELHT